MQKLILDCFFKEFAPSTVHLDAAAFCCTVPGWDPQWCQMVVGDVINYAVRLQPQSHTDKLNNQ